MLAPLVCLIGLTLVGQDGPSVSAAVRAPAGLSVEALAALWDEGADDVAASRSTPQDDELEDFPEEPEGDDEDDPGEAMGSKGRSSSFTFVVVFSLLDLIAPPPSLSTRLAPAASAKGSPLSLLCRLRF